MPVSSCDARLHRQGNCGAGTQVGAGDVWVVPEYIDLAIVGVPAHARNVAIAAARTRAKRDVLIVEVLSRCQEISQLENQALQKGNALMTGLEGVGGEVFVLLVGFHIARETNDIRAIARVAVVGRDSLVQVVSVKIKLHAELLEPCNNLVTGDALDDRDNPKIRVVLSRVCLSKLFVLGRHAKGFIDLVPVKTMQSISRRWTETQEQLLKRFGILNPPLHDVRRHLRKIFSNARDELSNLVRHGDFSFL